MNRLYLAEIASDLPAPRFRGEAFAAHIAQASHPRVRAERLNVWNLLARAVREAGVFPLPEVAFEEGGKPVFVDSPLHFSLSHSGKLAAVLLSDAPCGVDVEIVRAPVKDGLIRRVLTERERTEGLDFFDVWTRKECVGKLDGRGLCALETDVSDASGMNWLATDVFDSDGKKYRLAALCTDQADIIKRF